MESDKREKGSIVTVGTFDGLHRGHRLVLDTLMNEARTRGLRPLVITFDRHPLEVVAPERAPFLVMDPDRRDGMIASLGPEVERVRFTEALRRMTAAEWFRHLADGYGAEALVLGYDNTFGCDGVALGAEDYRRVGAGAGVDVIVAPAEPGCSSSAVRRALDAGKTEEAAAILGRPFSIGGRVEHGREIGRTIGVPTANIALSPRQQLPAPGVYVARVPLDGRTWPAVANIGRAPTVTPGNRLGLEVHIDGFDGDLYGREIEVRFGRRLRGECRFPSIGALREQIEADIASMRADIG